ncbi:glycoside hydrolase family 26 protein [Streptomyces sp. NPDC014806]|uniref:glycoside hydrolase family 26 protein n=1 Tax=Streptomyces sp. NPDC014806 TaxID=3364920 RepID=UPI0036F782F9
MAPQQRRTRSRRTAVIAAAAVASAVLASGPGFAAGGKAAARAADPAPPPTATTPVGPATPGGPTTPAGTTTPTGSTTPAGPKAPGTPDIALTPAAPPTPITPPSLPSTPGTSPASPAPSSGGAKTPAPLAPAFGAYLDYGPRGVARMAALSDWLGGTEIRVGHTYLPGDRWRNIEGPPGFLDVWADWRKQRADRTLVLNVPMLERNEEGVPDDEVRRLLRQGAAGQYDHHFRRLAERLVQLQVPDTVIVLGWEMNGITYTHRCGPDPQAWRAYWRRIVTTMRAVPGQRLRFDFAPSRGRDAVPWTECYPGDDTVDIVGMDSYDQPSGMTFQQQVQEPYGLQAHVDFAKAHHKPISYPEWGLFRNGDNPEYMRRMLAWMAEHKPVYNTLTDYCPHGVWQCSGNPRAAQVYRSALSGQATPTTPAEPTTPTAPSTPATPTKPTTPATPTTPKPKNCSPLDLGDWVEYWLGGKLCVKVDWWSRRS